jgi:hypothetical protein
MYRRISDVANLYASSSVFKLAAKARAVVTGLSLSISARNSRAAVATPFCERPEERKDVQQTTKSRHDTILSFLFNPFLFIYDL